MTLSLDIATDIYPVHVGQQLAFLLVSSLRRDKAESDATADRDAWRLDQDDNSLAKGFDYVMYGKVRLRQRSKRRSMIYIYACIYLTMFRLAVPERHPLTHDAQIFKYDERSTEQVTVYGSFGGLLMALTGSFRHLSKITVGSNVYLLMR